MKLFTFVVLSIGLLACGSLERHSDSGYAFYDTAPTDNVKSFYADKKTQEKMQAKQELGIVNQSQISEQDAQRLARRLALKRLEDRLISDRERKQYYHYKPMMKNDDERIAFLRIPTIEGRERYANARNLVESFKNFDDPTLELIEDNNIAIGMNQQAVRESWGDPDLVDVAGNEIYGNQAWRYTKMVSSEDGYSKENRVIYFENGRVAGWESF